MELGNGHGGFDVVRDPVAGGLFPEGDDPGTVFYGNGHLNDAVTGLGDGPLYAWTYWDFGVLVLALNGCELVLTLRGQVGGKVGPPLVLGEVGHERGVNGFGLGDTLGVGVGVKDPTGVIKPGLVGGFRIDVIFSVLVSFIEASWPVGGLDWH